MILPVCLLIVATTSAAMLLSAWRGHRIDDHPLCRRCGLDLWGKPADSHRCAECGADLRRKRATRRGHRRRRPGPALGAAALLVPSLAGLAVISFGTLRQVDWDEHKPSWWLLREAKRPTTRDRAMQELRYRLLDKKLSGQQSGELADLILKLRLVRSGATIAGVPESSWAEAIELTHERGQLTQQQWHAYWQQVLRPYLDVWRSDESPDITQVRVICWPYAPRPGAERRLTYCGSRLTIANVEIDRPDMAGDFQFKAIPSTTPALVRWVNVPIEQSPTGSLVVKCTLDVTVYEGTRGSPDERELVRTKVHVETTISTIPGLLPQRPPAPGVSPSGDQ